jgi:hypothetical protein
VSVPGRFDFLLHRLIAPPVRPMRRLLAYYLPLAGVALGIRESGVLPGLEMGWPDLTLILAMLTALALMLPVAWIYQATRRAHGADPSVVQTILALPVAVAGVILVVSHSLPLAFSLAGIVAAVRFRNTLRDSADMLFVFLAIAVGLTVGAQAATAAAVISIVFNLVMLTLWHCHVPDRTALAIGAVGTVSGNGHLLSPVDSGKKGGKKHRYSGVLSVQVSDGDRGQQAVEDVLRRQAERWQIDEIKKKKDGRTTLRYMVRIDKALAPESVLDAVLLGGAPYVVGAALG